jgi:hypothetical protein
MSGDGYVVPPVLRPAQFVPRQQPGSRAPMQVTPGAFRAAGLPVPEDLRQRNAYQLSKRQGWPWSPAIDEHVGRRGGELLGGDTLICLDCDTTLAVDGTVWIDGFRWLADVGVAAGELLDITGCVAVRTPGSPGRGHGPGWHLWWRAGSPVRMGPLARCGAVEVKTRCTCPGSPGYAVRHAPAGLPEFPAWIAALAGPPRPRTVSRRGGSWSEARIWRRLHGIVDRVLAERERGSRNAVLYWASCRAGELIADGALDGTTAERVLHDAAEAIGLVGDDGERAVSATIRSGLAHTAGGTA